MSPWGKSSQAMPSDEQKAQRRVPPEDRIQELEAEREWHLKALENIEAAIRQQRERMA